MSFLSTFDQDRRQRTSLYWAFGSNLCVRQMAYRCPGARKIKALPVYGAKLVFRGVADVLITDNQSDVCLGGLWRITPENEQALDRYEGVRGETGMYRKAYFYIRDKSRHYYSVLYYIMNSAGIFPPSEDYLNGIVEGYMNFGLDMTKLEEAVRHSWQDKNKTEDMRQRYLRNRPPLARSIEQAKRPMISASRPKPKRPVEPTRIISSNPPIQSPPKKHWPSWPGIGPGSKLLPKPKAEQAQDSLFPQEIAQQLNPLPQESADEMKRKLAMTPSPLRECCGAFSLGGPLCHDCPATSLEDTARPTDQLPHGED